MFFASGGRFKLKLSTEPLEETVAFDGQSTASQSRTKIFTTKKCRRAMRRFVSILDLQSI